MKKLFMLTLAIVLLFCLAGCVGGTNASPDNSASPTPGEVNTPDNTNTPDDTPSPGTPANNENIEGSVRDILVRLYEIYNARDDVINAQAEMDEISPRVSELNDIVWNPDSDLSDEVMAEYQAELEELISRSNILHGMLIPMTMDEDLTQEGTQFNDNIKFYIGADDIPFTEGIVSEPVMTGAYSVVLLRMEAGADIESAKTRIRNSADPMKWICVGVDPSNVIVDNIGDLVILIMAENSKELHETFLELR